MPLGTNPQNISNFTKPEPPDIKKPTLGARFNSIEEARAALRGNRLGTLPEAQPDVKPEPENAKTSTPKNSKEPKEQSSKTSENLEGK
jgi:hypothetical protein